MTTSRKLDPEDEMRALIEKQAQLAAEQPIPPLRAFEITWLDPETCTIHRRVVNGHAMHVGDHVLLVIEYTRGPHSFAVSQSYRLAVREWLTAEEVVVANENSSVN